MQLLALAPLVLSSLAAFASAAPQSNGKGMVELFVDTLDHDCILRGTYFNPTGKDPHEAVSSHLDLNKCVRNNQGRLEKGHNGGVCHSCTNCALNDKESKFTCEKCVGDAKDKKLSLPLSDFLTFTSDSFACGTEKAATKTFQAANPTNTQGR